MDQDARKRQHNWAVGRIRYEREKQDWLAIGIVHSQNDGQRQPVPLQIALVSSSGEVVLDTLIRPPVSWKRERVSEELLVSMKTTSDELFQAPPWEEIVPMMTKATMHKTLVCWDLPKTKQLLTVLARGKNKGVTLPSNRRFLNMENEYPDLILEGNEPVQSTAPGGNAVAIAKRLGEMMHSFDKATEYEVAEAPSVYHATVHLDLGRLYEAPLERTRAGTYDLEADEEETREYLEATKTGGGVQTLFGIGFLSIACVMIAIVVLGSCLGHK